MGTLLRVKVLGTILLILLRVGEVTAQENGGTTTTTFATRGSTTTDNDSSSTTTSPPTPLSIPSDCKNPMILKDLLQWNVDQLRWEFSPSLSSSGPGNSDEPTSESEEMRRRCSPFVRKPFHNYNDLINRLLRGKHLLFIGDSTVRNQLSALLGLVVNPLSFDECGDFPINHFRCPHKGNHLRAAELELLKELEEDATATTTNNVDEASNATTALYRQLRDEMETHHIGLLGFTDVFRFENPWSHRKAVVAAHYLFPSIDFRVTYITAGCGEDKGNSIFKALEYILRKRKQERSASENNTDANFTTSALNRAFSGDVESNSHSSNDTLGEERGSGVDIRHYNTSSLPHFDAIITSMMFHCNLTLFGMNFADGTSRDRRTTHATSPWARTTRLIRSLMKKPFNEKFLYLESPHCLKPHICPIWAKVTDQFRRQYLQPQGPAHRSAIPLCPQNFWTENGFISEKKTETYTLAQRKNLSLTQGKTCIFYDEVHAGLTCLRDGTMVTLTALKMIGAL